MKRKFIAYFFFVSWSCISLGLHIDFAVPNIEIHLPFGFIRIGWAARPINVGTKKMIKSKTFGISERW